MLDYQSISIARLRVVCQQLDLTRVVSNPRKRLDLFMSAPQHQRRKVKRHAASPSLELLAFEGPGYFDVDELRYGTTSINNEHQSPSSIFTNHHKFPLISHHSLDPHAMSVNHQLTPGLTTIIESLEPQFRALHTFSAHH